MSADTITYVICYDVSQDRRRNGVANYLESHGVRVQDSVFEARLTHGQAEAIYGALVRLLDPGDSLRMYALPPASIARSRTFGGPPLPEDGHFWIL